ncbi:GNAT family N-acetyltransferase [Ovoidimarina sediminis]|uniref:GNAT family N-acetyltransferase n=1 Tax=Ovoidimarina sediminis TaxID=3079856 RepID=UPI00290F2563|nr:GNAT family N-acetyltransferase [Rhodophyticola sp. MJ-SS7]MDU8944797.1 GNAT family N-acetyltransferase [Rhodophyticola sp. MJ-SS7]
MTLPHERPATGPAAAFAAHLSSELPKIETERLRLRAPRIEDFEVYAEIATGPEGRFLIDAPTRENAWYDFTQMTATWLLRGHGLWSVEKREDGALVGFVLLGFEPGDHEPELGYMFRDAATGHGYATEAARAARAHAFDVLALPTLVSTIDHDNVASHRLAERLGATRDAAAEAAHRNEIRVYRYSASEARL